MTSVTFDQTHSIAISISAVEALNSSNQEKEHDKNFAKKQVILKTDPYEFFKFMHV